ncbi:ankyrin repeat-containing domain protein, partial [Mycena latifolia]
MDTRLGTAMDVALASQYSHDIFWVLIRHGADVNTGGKYGTPMHRAAHHNDYSTAQLLIQHNADVNALGRTDHTALSTAASYGHLEIIRLLLGNKADANAQGGNALFAAAKYKWSHRLLITRGADVNATDLEKTPTSLENTPKGVTALYAAAAGGHDEITSLLIDHGADQDAR